MQGDRCMMMHDVTMMRKKTSNSNIGDFSGSLQSTPLTRDLAPISTLRRGRNWVNYRIFLRRVELPDTTNNSFFSTPPTRDVCSH
jgi:hypothetical protein